MADRPFTATETENLDKVLANFARIWTAHDKQLKAFAHVRYNRFIVLAVDETQAGASGCSIDKSVHLLKEIEKQLGVSLFNRLLIAYRKGEEIKTTALDELENPINEGEISAETIVFNNAITTLQQLDNEWETPMANCWMARYLPTKTPTP